MRFGYVGCAQSNPISGWNIPYGTDLAPIGIGDPLLPSASDEVFLRTETPPRTSASFVDEGFGHGWHEFVVPDDGNLYYFWVSTCLWQPSTIASETFPMGIMVGTSNTNAYSLQSGTKHLNDVWATFPDDDPYHFLIGVASVEKSESNKKQLTVVQFRYENIQYDRGSLGSAVEWGSTGVSYRGEYDNLQPYFAGDIVTRTDTTSYDGSPGTNAPTTYCLLPEVGGVGDPRFGSIASVAPGGFNTPKPWRQISCAPQVYDGTGVGMLGPTPLVTPVDPTVPNLMYSFTGGVHLWGWSGGAWVVII